jgi:hypothetical protein
MIGRAARNIGGEVVMYADVVTESMKAAIDETNRRRSVQEAYNRERGIEPTTIVKEIHDLNERLRSVAETTTMYTTERGRDLTDLDRARVEQLIGQMEAEMRSAARQLEFERAAALRDEIQQVRLRVLEEDASVAVARAAERAAGAGRGRGGGLTGAADRARAGRAADAALDAAPSLDVTSVTVLPAGEEPEATDGESGPGDGTAADWLPGIKDEHDDDGGWQARWLDRPTWDHTVTPNVIRRTGTRPPRPGRRRR